MADQPEQHQARIVVAAIIEDSAGRLLLVKEAQPEFYGLWNQPAGHVDAGEGIEEALLREIREETGYLHARIDGISKIYYFVDDSVLRINFRVSLIDQESGPLADDVLEARWFAPEELEDLRRQAKFRSARTEITIRDWQAGACSSSSLVQSIYGVGSTRA